MKKNISILGLLLTGGLLFSQVTATPKVLTHVDATMMYVGKGAIYYNGGGLQVKKNGTTDGTLENHGNVMLVAGDTANDVFRTLDNSNVNQGIGNTTAGKFVNTLNEAGSYANANTTEAGDAYTYGQLFISGFRQDNLVGVVDQQYRNVNHGKYEQIAFPFFGKPLSTLNTELGKTFNNIRRGGNEILVWDSRNVVFHHVNNFATNALSNPNTTVRPYSYFSIGGNNLNVSSVTRTMQGRPVADGLGDIPLRDAGLNTNFGLNGGAINEYNGYYNSYVQDAWAITSNPTPFTADYGRNIYQFGNPYMTNLDLRGLMDPADTNNFVSRIQGIRVELAAGMVVYDPNVGGGSTAARYIRYDIPTNTFVGDTDWAIVRPNSVFAIKMLDNSNVNAKINFDNLRKFRYKSKLGATGGVTNRSGATLKELSIIALDEDKNELGRAYFVVSPFTKSGFSSEPGLQVANTSADIIGTYEENAATGGYDNNVSSVYWLYINEANENDFKGKPLPLVMYSPVIKYLKYELKESGEKVPDGTTELSSGIGFYYQLDGGMAKPIAQGQIIPVTSTLEGTEGNVFYGLPSAVLGTAQGVKPSRTRVVYNSAVQDYIVQFDPNWKKAEIQVFDMSGKLVVSGSTTNTSQDYVIKLSDAVKNTYVVVVTSEKGEKVNTKIIK